MESQIKKYEYLEIFDSLNFLSKSIQLQYTNFLMKHQSSWIKKISLEEIVLRLKKDEPIEYVINLSEFCGNEFYVDKRCLIPRFETEEIVKKILEFISSYPKEKFTIVDVGTGSGAISLSIAKNLFCHSERVQRVEESDSSNIIIPSLRTRSLDSARDDTRIIGIDISKDALEVARINRERFNLNDKVEFIEADFHDFDFSKYENLILLANLPYIPSSRELQPSVINYEPKLALFGGENGDELIQDLKSKVEKLENIKLAIYEEDQGLIKYCYYH